MDDQDIVAALFAEAIFWWFADDAERFDLACRCASEYHDWYRPRRGVASA